MEIHKIDYFKVKNIIINKIATLTKSVPPYSAKHNGHSLSSLTTSRQAVSQFLGVLCCKYKILKQVQNDKLDDFAIVTQSERTWFSTLPINDSIYNFFRILY